MGCFRCRGFVAEEIAYDLPAGFREFVCLNCGNRFWLNLNSESILVKFSIN